MHTLVTAQNNGVIALTRCASRSAGYAAGGFMLLFGIIGKLAGWVLTIPPCILGGVMAFVFASIGVVGFKVRADTLSMTVCVNMVVCEGCLVVAVNSFLCGCGCL